MSDAPLPAWVLDGRDGVHAAAGSYSPADNVPGAPLHPAGLPAPALPDPLLGEKFDAGQTVFENDGVRMWHDGDGIAVVGFKTKMNTVSDKVLDGLQEAISIAERDLRLGDLAAEGTLLRRRRPGRGAGRAAGRQDRAVRGDGRQLPAHQPADQVRAGAGGRGRARPGLGGGCEFQMHSARTVAHLESYIGLVEAGVGLLPAGGGLKELAVRASRAAGPGGDVFAELKKTFETVAMAKVSASALEAKELGLLRADDMVVFNAFELLHVAKAQARALAEAGYRPPLPARRIQAAGDVGIATFRMLLVNMLEGRFISPYDDEIATRIANVLSGGEIDRGALVDEEWLLKLERKHFVELAQQEKTQARIGHMLKTGKPLRN